MSPLRGAALALVVLAGCSKAGDAKAPVTFKDEKYAYQADCPAGWTRVLPSQAVEFLSAHGDRVLAATHEAMMTPVRGKTSFAVAYVKTDVPDALIPIIAITHNSVGLPEVGPAELAKSRAMMQGKTRGWENAEEEGADLVEVDGLKAVRIGYRGALRQQLGSDKPTQRFELRYLDHMVPSRTLTHFVSLTADASTFDEHAKAYAEFLAKFKSFGGR